MELETQRLVEQFSIERAKDEIRKNFQELDGIAALKSTLLNRLYTHKKFFDATAIEKADRILNNAEFEKEETTANLFHQMGKFRKECFEVSAELRGELYVVRWRFAKDVITAYVRNCYEFRVKGQLSKQQIQKLFPVEELKLTYKIDNIHAFALKIKERRPEAYVSYVRRFGRVIRCLHGINGDPSEDLPPQVENEDHDNNAEIWFIKRYTRSAFRLLSGEYRNESTSNWGRVCLMLMILADACCGLIQRFGVRDPKTVQKGVDVMISFVAAQTAVFLSSFEQWNFLETEFWHPEVPSLNVIIPNETDPNQHEFLEEIFNLIPSLDSPQFAGVCPPPARPVNPAMVSRAAMLGRSPAEFHKKANAKNSGFTSGAGRYS